MVQYIGSQDIAALLEKQGIGDFIRQLCDYLRADFRRWEVFEKSARLASHSATGVIELMPTSDGALYAFKYVNGHPVNTEAGKLTVTAFGVLADVATGYPLLISEMTILTALRTAATSAMAAKALARPGSRRMALIGAGAQAEFQALAFEAELGITEISLYDPDLEAAEKVLRNLARVSTLKISIAASVEEACAGADIITTATAAKRHQAVLSANHIRPGQHINAIGGDCPGKTEIGADVLDAAKVFVEFPPQTRIEGDIQQMPADFPVTELWRVIAGNLPGRKSDTDITLFDSVGFAIEDFSTLRLVMDLMGKDARRLDLVPSLADPKNLFGALMKQAAE
ncbi:MAG: ornithine cyclodeaminase [Rhabdaerophilum sp.]